MRNVLSALVLAGLVFVFGTSTNAQHKKIGMKRAQAIATEHAKGLRLKAKELEHENGLWIYSFEFVTKGVGVREININAYTGAVVGIEKENTKKEASELKDDKAKKH
jgi:L,D-peptidoglycan transpeptidase YkuD (ErfK/YbiS/YcfS/YnhG family)